MNHKSVLGSLFILCAFLLEIHAFRPPKCRGKEIALTPEELETMEHCVKEYSTGGSASFGDVPMNKIGCVGKCIIKQQGLADPKGIPLKENISKVINGTLDLDPDGLQLAEEKLGLCIDNHTSEIDVREKACKTYWPFVKCLMKAFEEICAVEPATATESS